MPFLSSPIPLPQLVPGQHSSQLSRASLSSLPISKYCYLYLDTSLLNLSITLCVSHMKKGGRWWLETQSEHRRQPGESAQHGKGPDCVLGKWEGALAPSGKCQSPSALSH